MRKKLKQLIGILLTLVMVLGQMPGMGLTALAWVRDPYDSLLNTITVVHFDGKEWYLIEKNSTAANAGTVTLLAKECVGTSKYNSSGSYVEYDSSTVKTAVENWYSSNITNTAQAAVVGNKMFLLTEDQANTIKQANPKVLNCNKASGADANAWWLCSPGFNEYTAACVSVAYGYVVGTGDVDVTLGVRPALKLNLSSVIFSSESNTFSSLKPAGYSVALSGGANATTSGGATSQTGLTGAMTTVTYTANTGYYFAEFADISSNGITARRTSSTVVTVSGSPTADATITVPDAVAKEGKARYDVVSVQGVDHTHGDQKDAVIIVKRSINDEATFDSFTGLRMDEKTVAGTNYEAKPGGLKLTMKASYLNTLSEGKHTATILFKDGQADVTVTIRYEKADIPKTGDAASPGTWILMMLLGATGIVGWSAVRKKKEARKEDRR